jgi:SAM-dependent methyltransferase/uncharacterized protein YbaR (Trm112 family)
MRIGRVRLLYRRRLDNARRLSGKNNGWQPAVKEWAGANSTRDARGRPKMRADKGSASTVGRAGRVTYHWQCIDFVADWTASGPTMKMNTDLAFACPRCRTPLEMGPDQARCPQDRLLFERLDGIWRFLPPERAAVFEQFIREYETVRRDEGWGGTESDIYRALPYEDLTQRHPEIWRIRAATYDALREQVVDPLAEASGRPLAILDVGAGNGWLANRLAGAGHQVAAVDLLTNTTDGLGAHIHYETAFLAVQAEFDRLPFEASTADLVVFNGSLHYAAAYEETLGEALRVLRPQGQLAIMDSPLYHDRISGEQMVRERQARFQQLHHFRGDALPMEGFLTFEGLDELAAALNLSWQVIRPSYGWRWALRPWLARLLGGREPATFLLLMGQRRRLA